MNGVVSKLIAIARATVEAYREGRAGIDAPEGGERAPFEGGWTSQPGSPGGEGESRIRQYYSNLEIPYGSDMETVRNAWRGMMKKYHPDVHSNAEKKDAANELTRKLTEAYEGIKRWHEAGRGK